MAGIQVTPNDNGELIAVVTLITLLTLLLTAVAGLGVLNTLMPGQLGRADPDRLRAAGRVTPGPRCLRTSTTGLDLHDLEAETPPEVTPACLALVGAAPG